MLLDQALGQGVLSVRDMRGHNSRHPVSSSRVLSISLEKICRPTHHRPLGPHGINLSLLIMGKLWSLLFLILLLSGILNTVTFTNFVITAQVTTILYRIIIRFNWSSIAKAYATFIQPFQCRAQTTNPIKSMVHLRLGFFLSRMLAILRGIYGINFVGRRVGESAIIPCHFSAQILIRGPHAVVIFDCSGSKLAEEPPDLADFIR
jgi:hypothetical protein